MKKHRTRTGLLPSFCAAAALCALPTLLPGEDSGSPTSIWDGIYTEEQAERGAALYVSGCGDCHGAGLEGDDMSPPLIGSDFLWDWDGTTVGDMFERLRISMPDGDAKSMSTQEKADVLAYMYQQNGFPAGEQELAKSTSALRGIAFSAVEP